MIVFLDLAPCRLVCGYRSSGETSLFHPQGGRTLFKCVNKVIRMRITPGSRVLPEKLTRPQLLKKFPAFYETQKFITAVTTTRYLSLT
jgi:hypothetical protein